MNEVFVPVAQRWIPQNKKKSGKWIIRDELRKREKIFLAWGLLVCLIFMWGTYIFLSAKGKECIFGGREAT